MSDTYTKFHHCLMTFGGAMERVSTNTGDTSAVSHAGNSYRFLLDRSVTVTMTFEDDKNATNFMEHVIDSFEETRRRTAILRKYPAALAAWEQYKTVEALCGD